jgi:hypothetical protein
MVDLNASLCDLPVELKVLVLSHIEHIETHHILALSSTFQEAGSLLEALDFEGVAGDVADHLVRLLDDDRVRSLEKERALELIGVHKDRLCEYACVQRNFEVLRWARNELGLPWAQYPAEPVSDDVLVLRMLREASGCACYVKLKEKWRVDVRSEKWRGVTMENGRVVKLELESFGSDGAVPAEIWQLTALRELNLSFNQLTSLPAEIGQLTSLEVLDLTHNQLTSLPPEIGQLISLKKLWLGGNQLTSLPAQIRQLTSLRKLSLWCNQLRSVPAEIGQLTSLRVLYLYDNQLTTLPAEIGQLTSLKSLSIYHNNRLTSLPAEIGQLTSLTELRLDDNQLWPDGMASPAAIRELRAAGCDVVGMCTDEDFGYG